MAHLIGQLTFLVLLCTAGILVCPPHPSNPQQHQPGQGRQTAQTGPRNGGPLMARVAMGQSKMVVRPVAGIMHIVIYAGFILINIEVLEILVDGLFGTHRVFAPFPRWPLRLVDRHL